MKKTLRIYLIVISVIVLFSCSRKDGDWDDNIKLSTKAVEFSALADSVTVTTGGSWWWIAYVSVNGTYFNGFENVDMETDNYRIEKDCFVIERRNAHTLFIKVDENPLNVKRTIVVCLEAGNYFDRVTITQKSK